MKKIIFLFTLSFLIISCNKTAEVQNTAIPAKSFKTAYVDIIKLIDESVEAKDIESKYKGKASQMDNSLKSKASMLNSEFEKLKKEAASIGQAMAQQKAAQLQQMDQQLQYEERKMTQELQIASGTEMDSLFAKYKKVFKDYGKSKGYDYIFGDQKGEQVLFAKDSYDITKELIKLINDKYAETKEKK